jgi:flagella basal body P-ring formation protein FlgA
LFHAILEPGLVFAWYLEIMNTVKTSTPMKPSMQMLCRLLDQVTIRGLWLGALFCLSSFSVVANPSVQPDTTPAGVVQKAVVEWVAQTQSVAPDSVVLAPLDPRLQVRACTRPLAMDLPFASAETVRVRCAQPAWQLYVRVSMPTRAAAQSSVQTEPKPPEKRQVLVAAMPLQRGMSLTAAHVRVAEVDAQGLSGQVLEQVSQVLHAEMVRDVRPDTPLRSQDIRPTVLVKRGQMVLMSIGQAQGFQISARVEAQQDGRYGEQIKLKNRDSGRMLTGLVKGPNQVQGL